MKLGILLLNKNNVYLTEDGKLPKRPRWDKRFLLDLIEGQKVVCSKETLKTLPKSITDNAYFTTNPELDYDINFGIDTFHNNVDLLLIIRSLGTENGRIFNLNKYKLILNKGGLELWKLKRD